MSRSISDFQYVLFKMKLFWTLGESLCKRDKTLQQLEGGIRFMVFSILFYSSIHVFSGTTSIVLFFQRKIQQMLHFFQISSF